ncbi:hypothetical protein ADL15_11195 [Actinoplanes awajinensis subsp. mycoplanecinus]|uniref:Uncharacterized protein n=1 Tax=Actinoplanes awajinensis subsp. mycoplanecinus TaxID=135947 RepID=A0A0X3UYJ6_9ACTN|nr:hypothetical protein ADL15_11195 [Actinoplanes awajinensis subsp. mycoplanecinus]
MEAAGLTDADADAEGEGDGEGEGDVVNWIGDIPGTPPGTVVGPVETAAGSVVSGSGSGPVARWAVTPHPAVASTAPATAARTIRRCLMR